PVQTTSPPSQPRHPTPAAISFADKAGIEPGAQHVDLKRAVSQTLASASKDGEEQTQHDTDDDAGDDWEIEHRMLAFDANVARYASQPFGSEAAPQNRAQQNDNRADHHQEFSELAHFARRLRELDGGTRLRLDGSPVQRLLRNSRRFQNGDGRRDPECISETGAQVSS